MRYIILFLSFVLVVACGAQAESKKPTFGFVPQPYGVLPAPSTTGNVLKSNGSAWVSSPPGVNSNTVWWSPADRALAQGTTAADNGYPVGTAYRFLAAATITGVRFYCANGGTQTFTVHAASSIEQAVSQTQTELASKACASLAAGAIHICTFDTPVSVSDLTLSYTASVYGGSGVSDCAMVNQTPYNMGVGAGAAIPIGIYIWLEYHGALYGIFNSSTSLPNIGDSPRIAAAEFVFTIP